MVSGLVVFVICFVLFGVMCIRLKFGLISVIILGLGVVLGIIFGVVLMIIGVLIGVLGFICVIGLIGVFCCGRFVGVKMFDVQIVLDMMIMVIFVNNSVCLDVVDFILDIYGFFSNFCSFFG